MLCVHRVMVSVVVHLLSRGVSGGSVVSNRRVTHAVLETSVVLVDTVTGGGT
jgi:hypothetical protein